MTKNIELVEVTKINNPVLLCRKIYGDFIYLSDWAELQHTTKEVLRLLTNDDFIGFFLFDGPLMIGYLIGEIKHLADGRIVYYISYMYIDSIYRGNGLANHLMNSAKQKCMELGHRFLVLTCDTNKNVVNMYKKMGYTIDPILKTGSQHEVFTLFL